jgi:hypothetical protein
MSKQNQPRKYFEPATVEEIEAIQARLESVRQARGKTKPPKITPVISTVVRCLALGKSSRLISAIVLEKHGVGISGDTVLRFSKVWQQVQSN